MSRTRTPSSRMAAARAARGKSLRVPCPIIPVAMMDVQLTLQEVLERAVDLYPDREIVTAMPDGSRHRYTYADAYERICQLSGSNGATASGPSR